MAAKSVVLLLAVLALAVADSRVKKAVVVVPEDDGSYFEGKYPGTGFPYTAGLPFPYTYSAAAYAAAPYAAAPVVAAPYAAAPAVVAAPYAAAPVVAAPYAAAPVIVQDNGYYFPGKYGPENQ